MCVCVCVCVCVCERERERELFRLIGGGVWGGGVLNFPVKPSVREVTLVSKASLAHQPAQ